MNENARICANCKYWNGLRPAREGEGSEYDDAGHENEYRLMVLSPVPEGFGLCERTGSYGQESDAARNSKAKALDGEQYNAILATAPDFGCIQFESRGR